MKLCVILNPVAGSVTDLDGIKKKLQRLRPFELHVTGRRGSARRKAEAAIRHGCDLIIAAGGDGTLNEVVNGVAMAKRNAARIAIIPLGTGNDFARTLGLPASVDENIDIILSQRVRAIDLVHVKSDRVRYFVNISAGGFSGLVDEKLTPAIKRTWGPLAYVRSAAAAFPELHAYRTTILLDEKERFSIDVYNIVVANARYVAGGLPIAPEANPGDGLLDVMLIEKRSKPEMLLLAAQMLLGKHSSSDGITFRRAKRISIRSKPGMWFNADGELVGNEPAVFHVLPRALHFIVGENEK